MLLLNSLDTTLPISDPVLKFLIILTIILLIPILSDKIKIPHLLGLIIAGAVIGPHGLNLIIRDSSIILSGTAGLLYIMFLAGLEIDMNDFKKNSGKSTVLGLYGFLIPMVLGTLAGLYLLRFSLMTSVLMASMFASHTLITYPIVSKLGILKNRAVNISVGSSLITNVLALLVLAIIVGMSAGEINQFFWFRLLISFIVFSAIIVILFPIITRWFFIRFNDSISQYIFVLVMLFLGAVMSKVAGIESIIGAFLAGLSLNRLIPRTSPLMNRIDFVGNAIFIPFFLLSVGMLINYEVFFHGLENLKVAIVMSVIATVGKFLSAWLTQRNFRFTIDERRIIFGLTNSQAAATLAAVLIGYNIILGYTDNGEPIRLLNDSILNGTVIMILLTCTIASFVTQKGAQNIVIKANTNIDTPVNIEKILIPVSNPNTIEELINLSNLIKSKTNKHELYALNIIHNDTPDPDADQNARQLLEKAEIAASAVDIHMKTLLRYDLNIVNGITSVIKEHGITDLVLGLHIKGGISDSFLGKLTEGILSINNTTTFVYKPYQPIATIKRHVVIIPENAEYELGFSFWLAKIWNIALNTGTRMTFYSSARIIKLLRDINFNHPIQTDFNVYNNWDDFKYLSRDVKANENLIVVLSRKKFPSYNHNMARIPFWLNKYFAEHSFMLIYPIQTGIEASNKVDLTNPSLLETIEKIDVLGKTIAGIFRRK